MSAPPIVAQTRSAG